MTILAIILISIIVTAFAAAIFIFFNRKLNTLETGKENDKGFLFLQNQLMELQKIIDMKLHQSHQTTLQQLSQGMETNKKFMDVIREQTEKLARLDETNKQVISFTEQLNRLQDLLKNPKQRGILGEYYLETVLKNVLPPQSYQMQYQYKNGTIVDAAIFIKDKIIPIDSKFSLENYNRILEERNATEKEKLEKIFKQDLKNRIDETSKYIQPEETTMDFAFMFIPAEAIYYDLLVNQVGGIKLSTRDLIEYAMKERHVIIVSPTSFLAYLQTVLQGLRALQIEDSAKEIRKNVEKLSKHLLNYENYFTKLGSSLSATVTHFNAANKEFSKVEKDVLKITDEKMESELLPEIEKPAME